MSRPLFFISVSGFLCDRAIILNTQHGQVVELGGFAHEGIHGTVDGGEDLPGRSVFLSSDYSDERIIRILPVTLQLK